VLAVITTTIFVMAGEACRDSMLDGAVKSLREIWEGMIHMTSIHGLSAALIFNK
jgi:hypothetical protein